MIGASHSHFARALACVCLVLATACASNGHLPPPELVDADDKARAELGWQPRLTVSEGMARLRLSLNL